MSKSKQFAKSDSTEWRARGFKSSAPESRGGSLSVEPREGGNPARAPRPKGTHNNGGEGGPGRPAANRKRSGKPFKPPVTSANAVRLKGLDTSTLQSAPTLAAPGPQKKKLRVAGGSVSVTKSGGGAVSPAGQNKKKNLEGVTPNDQLSPTGEGGGAGEKKPSKPKRIKQKFRGYCLFVGNLSYDTTKEDVLAHFSKAGPIKGVRLPLTKGDNQPRGFAYIDVEDHQVFEKVLSLHHTFLKKRRINVECTFGGSKGSQKRKALIKEKTLKLRFLSREGKISSVKKRPWGKYTKGTDTDQQAG